METIQSSPAPHSLLIVEDDKAACEIISSIIPVKFSGITVYIANNGVQGLKLCQEHAPDIVITDINMPGMDGISMVEGIKALKADTKFIVLTGYSDNSTLDKFSAIGINEYMVKPLDFKKLFVAIERCLAGIVANHT